MQFNVGTADLRRALKAVAPHADPSPETPMTHRLRVDVGADHVTVSATQRYTIGHAVVWTLDFDGEVGCFDLTPQDVKEILTLFHGKKDRGDEPDYTIRVTVDAERVTFTDISGLFEGKALHLPRTPTDDNYPNVVKTIQGALLAGPQATHRLITSGKLHGLFGAASSAYEMPLVWDPAGEQGAMLVTCGKDFIGMLMPIRPDEETTRDIGQWHDAWLNRILAATFDEATPVVE
jgi:hypothetical protein